MIKKKLDIGFLWWLQILCGVEIREVLVNDVKNVAPLILNFLFRQLRNSMIDGFFTEWSLLFD